MTDTNQLIEARPIQRKSKLGYEYELIGALQKIPQIMFAGDDIIAVAVDVISSQQKRIEELETHLGRSLAAIEEYLEYDHDGDPWSEDARLMGEMEINEFERSGRLKAARAALAGKGGAS